MYGLDFLTFGQRPKRRGTLTKMTAALKSLFCIQFALSILISTFLIHETLMAESHFMDLQYIYSQMKGFSFVKKYCVWIVNVNREMLREVLERHPFPLYLLNGITGSFTVQQRIFCK